MIIEKILFSLNVRANIYLRDINRLTSTFFMRFLCFLKSIKLSKGSVFWGLSIIEKSRFEDEIIIGERCRFKSRTRTNLIGINRPCILSTQGDGISRLIIGDNCSFSGTVISCFREIIIGNQVKCGANTLITDSDWHLEDSRAGVSKPVVIEDNVWLGVNVLVMKGVRIGKNSVIGAGSVVTRDIPDNVIAAGNPCVVLKDIKAN